MRLRQTFLVSSVDRIFLKRKQIWKFFFHSNKRTSLSFSKKFNIIFESGLFTFFFNCWNGTSSIRQKEIFIQVKIVFSLLNRSILTLSTFTAEIFFFSTIITKNVISTKNSSFKTMDAKRQRKINVRLIFNEQLTISLAVSTVYIFENELAIQEHFYNVHRDLCVQLNLCFSSVDSCRRDYF